MTGDVPPSAAEFQDSEPVETERQRGPQSKQEASRDAAMAAIKKHEAQSNELSQLLAHYESAHGKMSKVLAHLEALDGASDERIMLEMESMVGPFLNSVMSICRVACVIVWMLLFEVHLNSTVAMQWQCRPCEWAREQVHKARERASKAIEAAKNAAERVGKRARHLAAVSQHSD